MGLNRIHLDNYFLGLESGLGARLLGSFKERMITLYSEVRAAWIRRGIMRSRSNGSVEEKAEAKRTENSRAMAWYRSGGIKVPEDPEGKSALKELNEFPYRTLAVSPTAAATERSFSYEKRIHTLQRCNLAPERVRKLLSCQWNARVLRDLAHNDEAGMKREARKNGHPSKHYGGIWRSLGVIRAMWSAPGWFQA